MNCEIYNTYENVKDMIRENREYYKKNTIIACNGKFHFRMNHQGIISVIMQPDRTLLCPAVKYQGIVNEVEEVENDRKKGKMSYQNMTFETFKGKNKSQIEIIRTFLYSKIVDYRVLIIKGEVGTGKTHLAKAIQFETLQKNYKSEFITFNDLQEIFFDVGEWNFKTNFESELKIKKLKESDYLIIDDLAINRVTKYFLSQFTNFLEKRTGKLIITTNLSLVSNEKFEEMADNKKKMHLNFAYDDRIISRLLEKSEIINLVDRDRRGNGKKND